MKKRVISITALVAAIVLTFSGLWGVLHFKYGDGILGLKYLYEQPEDSVDLLVLGSSHAFEDVNTEVLYDDYGIASYVLAGSIQPMWNTYYYLREALKTQHPKMIVIEGYVASQDFEYSDNSRIIKNNLGLRGFRNRLGSLRVSSPSDEFDNYLFDYRLWHSRYEETDASDYPAYYKTTKMKYYKGFGVNYDTQAQNRPDVDSFSQESIPVNSKEEKYFRMTLDLCKSENIPAMVILSPYVLTEGEQEQFNYLEGVCEEYDVPFVNFNSSKYYDKMKLDFATDFGDFGHLNYKGNVKYTKALASILTDEMKFPDRRGEAGYESWAQHSRDISDRTNDHLIASDATVDEFIKKINSRKDLSVYLVSYSGADAIEQNCSLFSKLGVKPEDIVDDTLYVSDGESLSPFGTQNYEFEKKLSHAVLKISEKRKFEDGKMQSAGSVKLDGTEHMDNMRGCYVVVYDNFTDELACVTQVTAGTDGTVTLTAK